MNNYDKLRQAAKAAEHGWTYHGFGYAEWTRVADPKTVLALLDENEALRAALRNLLPGQVQLDAIRAAEVALGDAS